MEMRKAENMVIHRDEIMSRPARTFIKTTTESKLYKGFLQTPKWNIGILDKLGLMQTWEGSNNFGLPII